MTSRVAKNPVIIPSGVDVNINGYILSIKGKQGSLEQEIHPLVNIDHTESTLQLSAKDSSTKANALSGTMRALVANMVLGVSEGFTKKLILKGVGYRAKAQGSSLNLNVGFSHPVDMKIPAGVTVETPSNTEVVLKGADKQSVCQVAANIRRVRPPEPYKGKGIRYDGEVIILKEGKKK